MPSSLFWVALPCAAAALALWLDVRYPRLSADSLQTAMLHAAASFLVITLVVPGVAQAVLVSDSLLAIEVAAIGVVLPGFVYALLACYWLVKVGQKALSGELR